VTITKKALVKTMLASGVILSIMFIIKFADLVSTGGLLSPLGEVGKTAILPDLFGGGYLAAIYLAGCIVMGVWYGIRGKNSKSEITNPDQIQNTNDQMTKTENNKTGLAMIGWVVGAAICLVGVVISSPFTADLVKKAFGVSFEKPVVLDLTSSWGIGMESLKYFPLTGYGPGLFGEAFDRFRPVSFNLTQNWNLTFFKSGSFVLEILTTFGGFAALIITFIFAYLLYMIFRGGRYSPLTIFLLLLIISFLLLPYSTVNWVLFFVVLGVLGKGRKKTIIKFGENAEIAGFGIVFLVIVGIAGVWYGTGKAWLADYHFKRYQDLVANKKVNEGYEKHLLTAINLNPYNVYYGVSASQANFVTARDLSAKEDLTDQERQLVVELLQRSITIARETTQKNPKNAVSWLNLATIYRGIINIADGAVNWAVESYRQAINISPNSPVIHFSLGGFLYGTGNYQSATESFRTSVSLKPNFANAYYNLAWTYRQQGMWSKSKLAMERAMELISKDSADYKKAESELAEIEEYLPKPTPAAQIPMGDEKEATKEAKKKRVTPTPSPVPTIVKSKEKLEQAAKEATESGIRQTKPPINIEE